MDRLITIAVIVLAALSLIGGVVWMAAKQRITAVQASLYSAAITGAAGVAEKLASALAR